LTLRYRSFLSGLLFSLLVALLIQQAGYFLIVVFGLSLLNGFPVALYLSPDCRFQGNGSLPSSFWVAGWRWSYHSPSCRQLFRLCDSFPAKWRINYPTTILKGLIGIALQLLGAMNLTLLIKLIGQNTNSLLAYSVSMSGALYGYWEFDMSMSPVVFGILIGRPVSFYQTTKRTLPDGSLMTGSTWLGSCWLSLIWVTIEFTLAKGLVYPILEKLPS